MVAVALEGHMFSKTDPILCVGVPRRCMITLNIHLTDSPSHTRAKFAQTHRPLCRRTVQYFTPAPSLLRATGYTLDSDEPEEDRTILGDDR